MTVVSLLLVAFFAYSVGALNSNKAIRNKYTSLRKDFFNLCYLDHKTIQDLNEDIIDLQIHVERLTEELNFLRRNSHG
jgi:hypothetical protein